MRSDYSEENLCAHGAYELSPASQDAVVSIFASGSEVEIALAAQAELEEGGTPTRVVSVPCFELFEAQSEDYRKSIIGDAPVKIGVEAAVRQGWDALIGNDSPFIGMAGFGASAPGSALYEHFGITAEAVVDAARTAIEETEQENA